MWNETAEKLERRFEFKDFNEALSFVNAVAACAQKLGHHPDICLVDYRSVVVTTTTHDAGARVTEKDRELARAIDALPRSG